MIRYHSLCNSLSGSIWFSINLTVSLSVSSSVSLFVLWLSIPLSISLSLYLAISLSLYPSIAVSLYLSPSLSILSTSFSNSNSVYLSPSLSLYLHLHLFLCLSFYLSSNYLSVHLSFWNKGIDYARLPSKVEVDMSKTKQSCETSSKFTVLRAIHTVTSYFVIVSDIPSGSIYGMHIYFLTIIFLAFYLTFYSDILLWRSIWHLFWQSFRHSIWHSIWPSTCLLRGRRGLMLTMRGRRGTCGTGLALVARLSRSYTHTRQEWIIIWSGRNRILKHAD